MALTTVVVAGASGVVGARVVAHLLAREDVDGVIAVGRRVLDVQHHKLRTKVVDFSRQAAIRAELADVDIAFCCLGTTLRKAGSRERFRAIDYEAVVAFAAAARQSGARRFLLVSSLGANAAATSFYLRTKGEVEDALAHIGFPQLTVVRPSLVDDEGARHEFRPTERLLLPMARVLFAVAGSTSRYAPIAADTVARAMVRLAFDGTSARVRVVESDELHRLGAHPTG